MSSDYFPIEAAKGLADSQLRSNLRVATHAIREKSAAVISEVDDWQQLREAGRRIKHHAVRHPDRHLEVLERSVTKAGGHVHWAADGAGANPDAWISALDPDPAASYTRGQDVKGAELADLFSSRCLDYGAGITHCADRPDEIAAAIGAACDRHSATALVAPATLEPAWAPPALSLLLDEPPLSVERLDACEGVITSCVVAIAATGTIVLDAGDGQGRRALTLVPDLHICVVRATQLVSNLPDAMGVVAAATAARRPVTFISGPSATSDIELKRVSGVHGPRRLEVVLVGEAPGG